MKHRFLIILVSLTISNSVAQTLIAPALKVGQKKWGYINERGEFKITPRYNFCYSFSKCGLAGVYDNLNNKAFFINIYGDTIIKDNDNYNLIRIEEIVSMVGFADSVLIVKKDTLYGAINTLGEVIIPIEYDQLSSFNEGLSIGVKDSTYFILDKSNNTIQVNINYLDKLNPFHNGRASFKTYEKLFGFINTQGEVVIEPQFLSVGIFEEDLTWAEVSDHKYGFIDRNGKWVISPRFWKAQNFNKGSYYAPVIMFKGDDYCFISKTGQELALTSDIKIKAPHGFNDGVAIVEKGLNRGCINLFGQWEVMPVFDYIWNFSNGYAIARKDSYLGIIDKRGSWTASPKYTKMGKLVLINNNTK